MTFYGFLLFSIFAVAAFLPSHFSVLLFSIGLILYTSLTQFAARFYRGLSINHTWFQVYAPQADIYIHRYGASESGSVFLSKLPYNLSQAMDWQIMYQAIPGWIKRTLKPILENHKTSEQLEQEELVYVALVKVREQHDRFFGFVILSWGLCALLVYLKARRFL